MIEHDFSSLSLSSSRKVNIPPVLSISTVSSHERQSTPENLKNSKENFSSSASPISGENMNLIASFENVSNRPNEVSPRFGKKQENDGLCYNPARLEMPIALGRTNNIKSIKKIESENLYRYRNSEVKSNCRFLSSRRHTESVERSGSKQIDQCNNMHSAIEHRTKRNYLRPETSDSFLDSYKLPSDIDSSGKLRGSGLLSSHGQHIPLSTTDDSLQEHKMSFFAGKSSKYSSSPCNSGKNVDYNCSNKRQIDPSFSQFSHKSLSSTIGSPRIFEANLHERNNLSPTQTAHSSLVKMTSSAEHEQFLENKNRAYSVDDIANHQDIQVGHVGNFTNKTQCCDTIGYHKRQENVRIGQHFNGFNTFHQSGQSRPIHSQQRNYLDQPMSPNSFSRVPDVPQTLRRGQVIPSQSLEPSNHPHDSSCIAVNHNPINDCNHRIDFCNKQHRHDSQNNYESIYQGRNNRQRVMSADNAYDLSMSNNHQGFYEINLIGNNNYFRDECPTSLNRPRSFSSGANGIQNKRVEAKTNYCIPSHFDVDCPLTVSNEPIGSMNKYDNYHGSPSQSFRDQESFNICLPQGSHERSAHSYVESEHSTINHNCLPQGFRYDCHSSNLGVEESLGGSISPKNNYNQSSMAGDRYFRPKPSFSHEQVHLQTGKETHVSQIDIKLSNESNKIHSEKAFIHQKKKRPSSAKSSLPLDQSSLSFTPPTSKFNNAYSQSQMISKCPGVSEANTIYVVKFKRTQNLFLGGKGIQRNMKLGCCVKVEADRGEDLGIVVDHLPVSSRQNLRLGIITGASDTDSSLKNLASDTIISNTTPQNLLNMIDLKRVIRLATEEEISMLSAKGDEEGELLKICRNKVRQRALSMNVVDAEYQFDRHKLTFFFEADGRIDFRELVRDLFSTYKTRIWMQQLDKDSNGTSGSTLNTALL